MTDPGEAEAVEAAVRAWTARLGHDTDPVAQHVLSIVKETVTAAYPVIAAALREQIARDIEREDPGYPEDDWSSGYGEAIDTAARVARAGARKAER